MSAQSDLFDAYTAKILLISDSLRALRATWLLDRWNTAAGELTSAEASDVISYSILGRTFTKRDLSQATTLVNSLEGEVRRSIYGTTRLVDLNVNSTGSE